MPPINPIYKKIALAPMMGWSTKAMQEVMEVFTPEAAFFSQMYHSNAILNHPRLLETQYKRNAIIQLGGSNPCELKKACDILYSQGYQYFNLNVGCPSPRVQKGGFGAFLMQHPDLVAECLEKMSDIVDLNHLSIKCRIGIDHHDNDAFLDTFVTQCQSVGIKQFIIHARIAKLKGLNPKQNRTIPPLNYDRVLRLQKKHDHIHVIINGGIKNKQQSIELLNQYDGIMFGRLCYENLYLLHEIYSNVMGQTPDSRETLLKKLNPNPSHYKFIHSVYLGVEGASRWRNILHRSANESQIREFIKQKD